MATENTVERANEKLINNSKSTYNDKYILKQLHIYNGRPKASEWKPFDIVLSHEHENYYINFHDGVKFIRFGSDSNS